MLLLAQNGHMQSMELSSVLMIVTYNERQNAFSNQEQKKGKKVSEIRKSKKTGRHYLFSGGKLYQLEAEGSKAYQAESILRGRDGAVCTGLMLEYAEACEKVGIVPHYSWRGVMNSLGDVGDKRPPWKIGRASCRERV